MTKSRLYGFAVGDRVELLVMGGGYGRVTGLSATEKTFPISVLRDEKNAVMAFKPSELELVEEAAPTPQDWADKYAAAVKALGEAENARNEAVQALADLGYSRGWIAEEKRTAFYKASREILK